MRPLKSLWALALIAGFSFACDPKIVGDIDEEVASTSSSSGSSSSTTTTTATPTTNSGVLSWAMHLGTAADTASASITSVTGSDVCQFGAVTFDSSGNIYCAGSTGGDLADTNGGGQDAFVLKMNSSGTVQWITQLGNNANTASTEVDDVSGDDNCYSVAVDSSGNVYCAGATTSNLNDTNTANAGDIFVMKLNSSGTLQWLTHFGTAADAGSTEIDDTASSDICYSVAVDTSGNVFCGGGTNSSFNDTNGGDQDILVIKLNSSGVIQWASHLGQNAATASTELDSITQMDFMIKIVLDSSGNIFGCGATRGDLNDTVGAGNDAIVLKLNSSGTLQWLTQLGMSAALASSEVDSVDGTEQLYDIALGGSGSVYVTGTTDGSLNDTVGGTLDLIVAKFDSAGSLQWLTQLGTSAAAASTEVDSVAGQEGCYGIAVDSSENVYCAGATLGGLNDTNGGGYDGFVLKLNSSGVLQWLTQLGSDAEVGSSEVDSVTGNEAFYGIAVDSSGGLVAAGSTDGHFNDTNGGSDDILVVKFQ